MTNTYFVPALVATLALATLLAAIYASTYARPRARFLLRLALRRLYVVGALALVACGEAGKAVEIDGCGIHPCDGGAGGAGGHVTTTTHMCSLSFSPCLNGHVDACGTMAAAAKCCDGETPIPTCARPAGQLTSACSHYLGATPVCNLCAVSVGGAVTCCDPTVAAADPCSKAVP